MLPRWLVLFLVPAAAAGGFALGWRNFESMVDLVCVGALPYFVELSTDAHRLAHLTFSLALGLNFASVPVAALLAQRNASRSGYANALLRSLLMGVISLAVATGYYRYQMQSFGAGWAEFLAILRESKREIALNPLTRTALLGAAATLLYGLVKGAFAYSPKGN